MTKKARLEAEYTKERNRITNKVRQMKKAGYDVSGIKIPKTAKQMSRVTEASVNRLKKMTTRSLTEKATKVVNGKTITRRQEIVRGYSDRGDKRRKKKVEDVEPVDVIKPVETDTTDESEILDEIEMLLDKFRQNIDYIDGLPEDEEHTQFYKNGGSTGSTKDDIVKILESYYSELSSICANKNPLPADVYDQLWTLANDQFFSLDHYGYDETEVADPLCAKMIELARALDDKVLEEKASELADEDEWVELPDGYMEQNAWMYNM